MKRETFPGMMQEVDSIEVRADGLDSAIDRLVSLRKKIAEQHLKAQTSSLKHEVSEAMQLAAIYGCGYESGIAVLDDLMPIDGRSWKTEIEDLEKSAN